MAMVKAMAGGSREDAYSSKLAINEAGYCYAGPPRPPYRILSLTRRQEPRNVLSAGGTCASAIPSKRLQLHDKEKFLWQAHTRSSRAIVT